MMNRLVVSFVAVLFVFTCPDAQVSDPVYFDRIEYGVGDAPAYAYIADLDGDGYEDVVSANKLSHDA
jgi:hypothetical protein